jgi:hypothetical protein
MDYPLPETNWICRVFGHRWRYYRDQSGAEETRANRRTCSLDGLTEPPFRKVQQFPPYDLLPDDQQPPGAV